MNCIKCWKHSDDELWRSDFYKLINCGGFFLCISCAGKFSDFCRANGWDSSKHVVNFYDAWNNESSEIYLLTNGKDYGDWGIIAIFANLDDAMFAEGIVRRVVELFNDSVGEEQDYEYAERMAKLIGCSYDDIAYACIGDDSLIEIHDVVNLNEYRL